MTSDTATHARQGRPTDEQPPPWQRRLRRFGYPGPRHASALTGVRERLVPPYAEPGTRLWAAMGASPAAARLLALSMGWAGPLLVALLAGGLRFWHLGSPKAVIFDETYYAKDAWALLKNGYEADWGKDKDINDRIVAGHTDVPDAIGYVVHPPVGKWVIAVGEWLHGLNPYGWRFMVALLGTLSVLMLCRIGRRMFRSTFLGCLAGALLAVDGLHFVMSRTALLDSVLVFFVLAAFGCLLVDRDKARERLAAALPDGPEALPDADVGDRLGLGWRPWRLAAGVCLGLAFATKWNGAVYLAAFGLLTVAWDVGSRRVAGARRPWLSTLRRDVPWAFASTVPVALGVYLASWTGWFANSGTYGESTGWQKSGYDRHWAETEGGYSPDGFLAGVLNPLRSLWHYEHQVWEFNTNLTSPHTYQSNPWSWLVQSRPVSYFYESPAPGRDGCPLDAGDKCAREVLALGTPLLWWAACFALLYLLYRWALRRDWRAGAVLCAVAAGYLPWFLYQERTIFVFYAVVFVPFLCLAVAMMIGAMLGPAGASERRRVVGAVGAGTLVLLIAWNFIYFFPIYTGQAIPLDAWRNRMWFDTWI
ncbi:dolichyl-phosphate-mannose--protein mannosyltransferase [Streptomyces griseocarneus]|uniref:dolichyl-phosphate-mannose--protein mannosyltransferase n=1 Tax=Streptomyces griseocarneus TaxID=51201 RepID=UPI00167E245E|nr:phospholipid carrier-dependent glycosyltransferase [Streptomyces griseocarneus]MBZ6476102.1 phospholipid carrier-dependent glycosyltransferase [Streptomyces griseocarneus]GHG77580.1 phospholipid carrier-dependent glycosyltransferase [Streptomyces griseocarneus]